MDNKTLTTVYILDDDPTAIHLLRKLLNDYTVDIVGSTSDHGKAISDILDLEPDLLFLDVEMPATTGLELWAQLRRTNPMLKTMVVFYSGYDKYLLEALRRQAFDYLLKPATPAELAKIMTRYYEHRLSNIATTATPPTPAAETAQPIIIVNALGEHITLRISDIAFFRYLNDRKLWEVVTTDGEAHLLRHRTNADAILDYSPLLVQIHKHHIVNTTQIQKIVDTRCVLYPPLDRYDELRISKNYRHQLMSAFYDM